MYTIYSGRDEQGMNFPLFNELPVEQRVSYSLSRVSFASTAKPELVSQAGKKPNAIFTF